MFETFLDRIESACGEHALVEAVRNGYSIITESIDDADEYPDVPGWTKNESESTLTASYRYGNLLANVYYDGSGEHMVYLKCVLGDVVMIPMGSCHTNMQGIAQYLNQVAADFQRNGVLEALRNAYVYLVFNNKPSSANNSDIGALDWIANYSTSDAMMTVGYVLKFFSAYDTDLPYIKDVLQHFLGDNYKERYSAVLKTVDPVDLYAYVGKCTGYNLKIMPRLLHVGMLRHVNNMSDDQIREVLSSAFDRMVHNVELDPLTYADDNECLFKDYARTLV